ncbi:unnamed protein product, partial [Mesorhabditis belari]|uniref:Uncharacterized protein n=1 Tax=Mesorhabditis belari TaxID=2138241 RepID=A0AAF3EJQ8_9BILA
MSSTSGRPFVPSLGSVSEVDGTDGEDEFEKEEQREEMAAQHPVKPTWKQTFLVCIGLADRRDDGELRNLLHPERYANNGRVRSGGTQTHSASRSPKPSRSPRSSRSPGLLVTQRDDDDDVSARDESFQTASRGSSNRLHPNDGSDTSSTPRSGSNRDIMTPIAEISDSYKGSPKVSPHPRVTDNPAYDYNRSSREEFPRDDAESRSSGSSSVSQSHSLPPGVEIREGMLAGPSSRTSSRSDTSYQKAAHSLLEPVLANARKRSDEEYPPRQPDFYSFDEPSPSRERMQTPLAQLYANPHNSYTSAMMSPIMADYSLLGGVTTEDSESNDEHTHLLPMTTSSGSSGKNRMKTSTSSGMRPPRFRISTSPLRKRLEEDSDSSARRFEMRIDEEGAGRKQRRSGEERRTSRGRSTQDRSPMSPERSPATSGSPTKRNVTHTIV